MYHWKGIVLDYNLAKKIFEMLIKKKYEQISEHMIFGFQNICPVGWDSIRNSEWVGKNEIETPNFMYLLLVYL